MSGGALNILPATVSDLDEVMAVMGASFDPEFGEAWTAPQCAGLLSMPGVWLTLARRDGEPVGFALSRVIVGEAELLLLAVKRSARRQGIGGALLDAFVGEARARGAEKLHLEVRLGNDAEALYRRGGFQEVGRRFNYYRGASGQLYDALTLARPAKS